MKKIIKNILKHQNIMKKRLEKNFKETTNKDIDLSVEPDLDKLLFRILKESEESSLIRQNLKDYDDKYIKEKVEEIISDLTIASEEGRSFILKNIKPRTYESIKLILENKGFNISIYTKSFPFGSEESIWTINVSI